MSYIKINKPYLDYDYYAMFHSYTMNNFVRNIMRKGKYKKALKIARLGLIGAIKRIYRSIENDAFSPISKNRFYIPLNYKRTTPTYLSTDVHQQMQKNLNWYIEEKYNKKINSLRRIKFKKESRTAAFTYYIALLEEEKKKDIEEFNLNIAEIYNKVFVERSVVNGELDDEKVELDDERSKSELDDELSKSELDDDLAELANNPIVLEAIFRRKRYSILESLSFQKIYTKKPSFYFSKNRQYTVFDLVIQVYAMLANIWYMKKIKVSGRTVLVPTPLRPYRRVSVVTQMIMKGLRKLRRQERFYKNAMIHTITMEFWRLGLYYNPVQYHPNITGSTIWQLKEQSHKDLIPNLKNLKHANYI